MTTQLVRFAEFVAYMTMMSHGAHMAKRCATIAENRGIFLAGAHSHKHHNPNYDVYIAENPSPRDRQLENPQKNAR